MVLKLVWFAVLRMGAVGFASSYKEGESFFYGQGAEEIDSVKSAGLGSLGILERNPDVASRV